MNAETWLMVRRVLGPLPQIAKPTFFGGLVGMVIMLVLAVLRPSLEPATQGVVDLYSIPDGMWIGAGLALVLLVRKLQGRPLINDRTQEHLDVIGEVMREGKFSITERRQVCRELLRSLVRDFSIREDMGRLVERAKAEVMTHIGGTAEPAGADQDVNDGS